VASQWETFLLGQQHTRRIHHAGKEDFDIGRSCTSNPKSEIADRGPKHVTRVRFEFSDFGFDVQESSNFKVRF